MLLPADLASGLPAGLPVPVGALAGGRLGDGTYCDITISAGIIVDVQPAGSIPDGPDVLDAHGYVVLPAAADAHSHLDKAMSIDGLVPAYGDLTHAIEQWVVRSAGCDEQDYYRRGRKALLELLSQGTTAVRTHCNLTRGADPLIGMRAMLRLRAELAGVLDLEIAVLPAPDSPTEDIIAAMDAGADIVGGCPHLAPDPEAELRRVLQVAHLFGTGVDIHADEQLTPSMLSVRSLAREVRARPLTGTVTAGHCVSLGPLEQPLLGEVVAELAAAGVGVVSLPITNLYLQGWDQPVRTPRGLTALRALLDGGVTVGAGGDNIRDPFNPVGRADPLETAALLVVAGHLSIEEAADRVTHGSRAVMGLPRAGAEPGAVADLLLCQGDSLADVVARAPQDRVVLHGGSVVAASATRFAVAAGRNSSD